MNLDQMQAFVNAIDVTVLNNYFQTYTFAMHPMVDPALPPALYGAQLNLD